MIRRPVHRAGFSLVEVLVALFIVAAGLIALLTLFPLGAIQMGKALQSDRSQQCALQMDGKIREYWRSHVVENTTPTTDPYFFTFSGTNETVYNTLNYFDDSDGAALGVTGTLPAIGNARRASYPVMFDPLGYASFSLLKRQQVAQTFGGGVFPRRTVNPIPVLPSLAYRYATLQDDMEFGPDSTPANGGGESVQLATTTDKNIFRAGRYNCAAVLQRPDNSNRFVADLKILVFDRRAPGVDPPGNEIAVSGTSGSQATGSNLVLMGDTIVTLNASNDTLGLRRGSWVMDGTLTGSIRNVHFYRVVSVDAETDPTVTRVEFHIPIVKPTGDAAPNAAYTASFYVFRELIDVYDRPQLTPTGYLKQSP